MKGMELPISTIVIILLALLIILAVAAMFFGVWNPGKAGITLETTKSNACQLLVSMGCNQDPQSIPIRDFDANKNGTINEVGGINGPEPWMPTGGSSGDNCGSRATSGDNLATLCLCYYNLNSADSCRNTLCRCTS